MGERASYEPGTFSWVDLSTDDHDGAKAFYGGLFGWTFEDRPSSGGAYSMARKDGNVVGGVYRGEGSFPPHWNCYVTVDSADAAADCAKAAGGTVVMDPFDVEDVGRMSLIQDPTGAFLALWEPGGHHGAALVNAPGALCWNELVTPDPEAAQDFYTELLGWEIEVSEAGRPHIKVGDRYNGSIREDASEPPHWAACFAVEDMAAATARIEELGGKVLVAPMDVGVGSTAVATDPQGAVFAIFAGQLDD